MPRLTLITLALVALGGCPEKERSTPTERTEPAGTAAPPTVQQKSSANAGAGALTSQPGATLKAGGDASSSNERTGAALYVVTSSRLQAAVEALAHAFNAQSSGSGRVRVRALSFFEALRRAGKGEIFDVLVAEGYGVLEVAHAAKLVDIDSVQLVTHLPLTLTVATKHAATVKTLDDLKGPGIRLGIADPTRSVGGIAARNLMHAAGLAGVVRERAIVRNPGGALQADAVDAYVGWGPISGTGVQIPLPAAHRVLLPIPAAVSTLGTRSQRAQAFVNWLTSDTARGIWERAGSVVKPPENTPVVATILPQKMLNACQLSAALAVGGRALLVGGKVGAESLNTLSWFDPNKLKGENTRATLPTGRHGVALARSPSTGDVLIIGGIGDDGPLTDILSYNMERDRVDRLNVSLPFPLGRSAVARMRGRVYLFGGIGRGGKPVDTILRINADTADITELPIRLPRLRSDAVALVGGYTNVGASPDVTLFNPATETVSLVRGKLPTSATDLAGVSGPSGRFIFGGRHGRGLLDGVFEIGSTGRPQRLASRLPLALAGASAVRIGQFVYLFGGRSRLRIEDRIIRWPF
jgi:ABC-type molybdate transport system substrate-binding protein